jgi:hypothetical protein
MRGWTLLVAILVGCGGEVPVAHREDAPEPVKTCAAVEGIPAWCNAKATRIAYICANETAPAEAACNGYTTGVETRFCCQ